MSLLKRLKTATHAAHERMELHIDLPTRLQSLSLYQRVIEDFYGFYTPVETTLRSLLVNTDLPMAAQRWKSANLAADLAVLGADPAAVPLCGTLPSLTALDDALGCLYVLEGATLGGQVIVRQLERAYPLDRSRGLCFFNSYGDAVGPMWQAFGAWLETQAQDSDRVIASADATFAALENWFTRKQPVL